MKDEKLFSDALLVAFLSLRGLQIKPRKLPNNERIAFSVEGERVEEAVEEFYSNVKVPISTFCAAYRNVRSIIFNSKGWIT